MERIYQDKNDPQREDSARVLGWLVCAKRPLYWHEIQGAISMDTDEKTLDFEAGQLRVDSKDFCGSLIEVHSDETIELVHATARL